MKNLNCRNTEQLVFIVQRTDTRLIDFLFQIEILYHVPRSVVYHKLCGDKQC